MVMELVIPDQDSESAAADNQEAERQIKLAEIDESPAAVEAADILAGGGDDAEATSDATPGTATDEEIKQAAQFQPGSVTPAAEIVTPEIQIQSTQPTQTAKPPQDSRKPTARELYLRDKADMEERLAGLTIEEMKLKEQAKLCKKEREVLAEQLSNLIDGWEIERRDLEKAGAGGCAENSGDQSAVDPTEPASSPVEGVVTNADQEEKADQQFADPAENEDAKQARYQQILDAAPVSDLNLPKKLTEKLEEAGATTVWKLEQLRAEIANGTKEWPKGIGEGKITQIEDAILKWMSAHSETWDAPADEPTAADASQADSVASLIDDL